MFNELDLSLNITDLINLLIYKLKLLFKQNCFYKRSYEMSETLPGLCRLKILQPFEKNTPEKVSNFRFENQTLHRPES